MLSLREKLAKGIFESNSPKVDIPKKSPFLGIITEDGYCDYNVPEDDWYINKDTKRAERLMKSTRARKQRQELRRFRISA